MLEDRQTDRLPKAKYGVSALIIIIIAIGRASNLGNSQFYEGRPRSLTHSLSRSLTTR